MTQEYSNTKNKVADVKAIPIRDVVERRYGLQMTQKGDAWTSASPLRPGSSPTSFSYSERNNLWKDWTLGVGGDVISLVMKAENVGFVAAVDALYKDFYGPDREPTKIHKPIAQSTDAAHAVSSVRTKLTDEELDRAYNILLDNLYLTSADKKMLNDRHLSDANIREYEFRTLPEPTSEMRRRMTEALQKGGIDASAVPGLFFFKNDDRVAWPKIPGVIIPIRNENGQICALQIRKRELLNETDNRYAWFSSAFASDPEKFRTPGSSPGARAAILPGYKSSEQIFITEGFFKGQKLTSVFGSPSIALSGVTSWQQAPISQMLEQYPNAKSVYICFDADAQRNPAVFAQMKRLSESIKDKHPDIDCRIMTWDFSKGKGIDDYFNENPIIEAVNGLRGMTISEFEKQFYSKKDEIAI